ncbi:MAG: ribonuclease H-like domain-containing protein [Mogibacterium sp.]|nr:ribonuclease H-like domain-containing protein [Mogibacterium sp.]
MKVFKRNYRMEASLPSSYMKYMGGMKPCVLDIETTGLSRGNSKIILIGLLTETDSGVCVTQFLAENHYEEYKVLQSAVDFLRDEGIEYLVTYNGASFDIPFIERRLEVNSFEASINLYNLDLYRFIKCATDLRNRLDSLSQKSVENYYGILDDRADSISGRESVKIFDEYSLSGDSTLEKIILTHNREDVLNLFRLIHYVLPDADVECMDKAMAFYGFPVLGGRLTLRPSIQKFGRGSKVKYTLRINGDQNFDAVSAAYFADMDNPINAVFNRETAMFQIEVPIEAAPEGLSGEDDLCYLDIRSILTAVDNRFCSEFERDPDYINGYLILNPRTVNLAARLITEKLIEQST